MPLRTTEPLCFEYAASECLFGRASPQTLITLFTDPIDRLKQLEIDTAMGRLTAAEVLEVAKTIIEQLR